ncbi:hypothetical protein BDV36DRAFT_278025 [Aspergillus pseudocaelatus]|uniref:Uncharacterized protein n=1 Tax=Aspergillus pseudocaelatus TaxID=1825620 RepID=A0ABQ6W185_9EURO|nr:hypothetical protein BDV36DRAFT_278025 [Aspergillus pseudocaelatus]
MVSLPCLYHARRSLCHLELIPEGGYSVFFFISFLSSFNFSLSVSLQVYGFSLCLSLYIVCKGKNRGLQPTPFTYMFCGRLTKAIDIRVIRVLAPTNSQRYACTLDIPRSTSYI